MDADHVNLVTTVIRAGSWSASSAQEEEETLLVLVPHRDHSPAQRTHLGRTASVYSNLRRLKSKPKRSSYARHVRKDPFGIIHFVVGVAIVMKIISQLKQDASRSVRDVRKASSQTDRS